MRWTRNSWLVAVIVGTSAVACSGASKVVGIDDSAGGTSGSGPAGNAMTGSAGKAPSTGALGAPCVLSDESDPDFAGFDANETNIDNHAVACASQFCILNHFQGRASCPYGQAAGNTDCFVPGESMTPVTVAVKPQLKDRQTAVASICSCQCSGYGPGPYCTCPETMECDHLVDKLDIGNPKADLSGSYCIPLGSSYDRTDTVLCSGTDCGDAHPY